MFFPVGFFKRPMVVFTAMLFILAIFIPLALPSTVFGDFNTDGETWIKRGWTFGVNFDTPNVIGSWKSNADSETFTVTGKFGAFSGVTFAVFTEYRYALYVDGSSTPIQRKPLDGSWFDAPKASVSYNKWFYLQPWTTKVKTDGDVRLKVVIEVKIYDYLQTHTYSDPNDLAWDGANVLSGAGAIYLPASEIAKSPFEAGETPQLYVETGFSGGDGWTIYRFPPTDRTDLDQTGVAIKSLGDNIKGTYVGVTVGSDWFKVDSTNRWKFELWNNYFARVSEEILAIDDRERAPIITDISWVNNGDSLSYTVTIEETYNTLSDINVAAWYSYGGGTSMPGDDTESWILQNVQYPIIGGTSTFTVYPKSNIQGLIIVKVIAYDIDGRPSTPDYESFSVDNDGTDPTPPPYEQPFVWTTSALIISVLLVLGIVAIMWFAPVGINIKLILVMIIGIAGAVLVWLAGTLQLGG